MCTGAEPLLLTPVMAAGSAGAAAGATAAAAVTGASAISASTALTAATLAAAAVSTVGTLKAGADQRAMAEYNAAVAEQGAAAARDKAAYDEAIHREQVRKILSSQRALYGVSGVDMTGSPLLVMEDTARKGELDALAIRYGGDVAAARERSAANLSRMQGKAAQTASYFQAGSTLLQGASNAYINKQYISGQIKAPTVVSR